MNEAMSRAAGALFRLGWIGAVAACNLLPGAPSEDTAVEGARLSDGEVVTTLVAVHSRMCLDVPVGAAGRGVQLVQAPCSGSASQRFHVTPSNEGVSTIRPANEPGLCLDLGSEVIDGGPIVQTDCSGGTGQRFTLRRNVDGSYAIATSNGGGCVDISGVSRDPGAPVQSWTCHGGANQSFIASGLSCGGPSEPEAPPPPTPEPPPPGGPVGDGDVNVLVRGQSNALLFVDYGGVWTMRARVASALGIEEDRIHVIADWARADEHNTINSGTSFINEWMTPDLSAGRLERGLLDRIADMSAAERARPTVVFWLHNEYDGQIENLTAERWVSAVRADAAMVRGALGQPPARSPYVFCFLPYGYASGDSPQQIKRGQAALAADPAFSGVVLPDVPGEAMGDPSHMSKEGSDLAGETVAPKMADVLRGLL